MGGRILTLASNKGGVGRTTSALNLGYALARVGAKVVVVDADPQDGVAASSGLRARAARGLREVLDGETPVGEATVPTRVGGLALLGAGAADRGGAAGGNGHGGARPAGRGARLGAALAELARAHDYVLVDAPPGVGHWVRDLLAASDGLLVPLAPSVMALRALPALLRLALEVRAREGGRLRLEGVFITMRDVRSELGMTIYDELRRALPAGSLLRSSIPFDERFRSAALRAIPVALLDEGADAAEPYLHLAMELRARELAFGPRSDDHDRAPGLF